MSAIVRGTVLTGNGKVSAGVCQLRLEEDI